MIGVNGDDTGDGDDNGADDTAVFIKDGDVNEIDNSKDDVANQRKKKYE